MNTYLILANLTAVFHGIVAVYLISWIFFIKRKVPVLYYIFFIPVLLIQWTFAFINGKCPLVILENYFRKLAEQEEYNTGFIVHYCKIYTGINIDDSLVNLFIGIISAIIILILITRFFPKKERSII